ncbi:MAG: NapC/NirT family cytochrome c [Magnetococcales bacterium]|nr:NapC/NirT family cytochrome c [Magnetococcales bacterium]
MSDTGGGIKRLGGAPLKILAVFFLLGILFWGAFHWALDMTNRESFCITCHEMKDYVYKEYTNSVHYANRTGVRATCPDCHVPKQWQHMIVRKIQASAELYHKAMGSIDTPEKFEAKRLALATKVWNTMKATDSRECRNCHEYQSMDFTKQGYRGFDNHERGFSQGKTCIDCHKGIAHRLPLNINPNLLGGTAQEASVKGSAPEAAATKAPATMAPAAH